MNATAAQIPPDPTDTDPDDGAPTDRPPRRKVAARRRERRRVWALGLLASAVLHAVLLFAATRIGLVPVVEGGSGPIPLTPEPRPEHMQLVRITEAVDAAIEPPEPQVPVEPDASEPEPMNEPPPRPDAPAPTESDAAADRVAERVPASPAERIRPQMGDSRLWAIPHDLTQPLPSGIERVREQIYAELEAMNDSMLTALAAEAAARDWTIEGDDGGRWGVTPGKLHLGDLTIPLPISFPLPREAQARVGEWSTIQRQAARAQINEWVQERIEAIRERRERERSEGQDDSGSG